MQHREPFWQVQSVFDPDGEGGDFGYTIGLAARGVPELHMWGRPSLGEDPGEDWKFSCNDLGRILNELAWQWIDGDLQVGDTFEREYDDGLVTACFRVDPPQDSHSLEAFGARQSPVVPIRWSLRRVPTGVSGSMTEDDQLRAEVRWHELVKELDPHRSAPTGWRVPTEPSWAVDQKYGPRTPLVLALVARLWQADADDLGGIVQVGSYVDRSASLTYSASVAASLARPIGRHEEVRRLHRDVHDLCDELGGPWLRRPFREMQEAVMGPGWSPHDRRHHASSLRHLIADVMAGAACVEAVADVASSPRLLEARGPYAAGFLGPGQAPGPNWIAHEGVLDSVRALLHGMSSSALVEATQAHVRAMGDAAYLEVFGWLIARSVTSAACAPTVSSLLDAERHAAGVSAIRPLELGGQLQEWVTALTAALCCRDERPRSWLDAWLAPYSSLLPELTAVFN